MRSHLEIDEGFNYLNIVIDKEYTRVDNSRNILRKNRKNDTI